MKCALQECSEPRFANGVNYVFCKEHVVEFNSAPEGKNLRPTSLADFRDRKWKEYRNRVAAEQWEKATPEERAHWKKNGLYQC